MDLKAVGKRIKAAREQKGLTQEALAELVNLSPMHVSVIERGFKPTKMDTFCNIANALDVSADTLLQDVIDHSADSVPSDLDDLMKGLPAKEQAAKYTTASKRILKPTMKTADFGQQATKSIACWFPLL